MHPLIKIEKHDEVNAHYVQIYYIGNDLWNVFNITYGNQQNIHFSEHH